MSTENTTSFQLAPGETNVYGAKVAPSLLTPYLKGELMCSSTRLVYKVPNTIFGLIPAGASENTVPLKAIASVNTSTSFEVGRIILGVALVLAGFGLGGQALLFVIFGVMFLAMAFPAQLNVVNHAGGVTSVKVSILHKNVLQQFAKELQGRVFADLDATRHDEAQMARMMQMQLQQMQLQQMQVQNENRLNDQN
ncbi:MULTISPECIES: hypothetical protein [unclassified Schaalia]|uniref:hypothetical protein n=1 Tax=unclassified Schaalia TaxID=2691889 RepID=UPI001E548008|nr:MULTISPECIES: hypothetical protein [unclassified Schaalia]MCD4549016.1 hypothetical protein [Schaalia sp. lx-260]MCD4557204.1 hypothetical protein [Schaalia sp. lx-100]